MNEPTYEYGIECRWIEARPGRSQVWKLAYGPTTIPYREDFVDDLNETTVRGVAEGTILPDEAGEFRLVRRIVPPWEPVS